MYVVVIDFAWNEIWISKPSQTLNQKEERETGAPKMAR